MRALQWGLRNALIVLGLVGALSAHAAIPYEAVSEVSVSTGRRGDTAMVGSGVLLDQSGILVTNIHVIEDCLEALNIDPRTNAQAAVGRSCSSRTTEISFRAASRRFSVRGATILKIGSLSLRSTHGPYRDFVVLQLSGDFSRVQTPKVQTVVTPGEALKVVGYPSRSVGRRVNRHGLYESAGFSVSHPERMGFWQSLYATFGLSAANLQTLTNQISFNFFADDSQVFTSSQIYPGYSGGGIFNAKGELVGIVWGTLGLWTEELGRSPKEIQLRPSDPNHPGNKLASGVSIKEILN